MKNYIYIEEELNATGECVEFLNTLKTGKWKRINKFSLFENTLRVFKHEDGSEVTLVTNHDNILDSNTQFFNKNLYYLKALHEKLKPILKKYYDTDGYGYLFLNPLTMDLMISCSDGGCIYSELGKKEIEKHISENGFDDSPEKGIFNEDFIGSGFKDIKDFEEAKEINSIEFEGEYIPSLEDMEDGEEYIIFHQLQELDLFF